jgi:hypothetical protein
VTPVFAVKAKPSASTFSLKYLLARTHTIVPNPPQVFDQNNIVPNPPHVFDQNNIVPNPPHVFDQTTRWYIN